MAAPQCMAMFSTHTPTPPPHPQTHTYLPYPTRVGAPPHTPPSHLLLAVQPHHDPRHQRQIVAVLGGRGGGPARGAGLLTYSLKALATRLMTTVGILQTAYTMELGWKRAPTNSSQLGHICKASAKQRSAAQRSAAQQSRADSAAQRSTAQHSTAQHSTAQHSTAQHSTAQKQ
jgi:hypothetical protein